MDVFLLLSSEGLFITLCGTLLGMALLSALTAIFAPLIQAHYGLTIIPKFISYDELGLLGMVMGVSLLASLLPGYGAYKLSLADGLTPRI